MLLALLADVARIPGVTVCTTWDARLGDFPLHAHAASRSTGATGFGSALQPGDHRQFALAEPVASNPGASRSPVECLIIGNPRDESAVFRRLAAECDATYVIAPELDDLLTQRVHTVLDAGGRSLNAAPDAIAACSDKWETCRRLSAAGIPTVRTARFDPMSRTVPFDFPVVLKPRFGAGSQDTFLIRDADQLHAAAACFSSKERAVSGQPSAVSDQNNRKSKIENPKSHRTEAVVQPYIPGRTLSVAAIFRSDGTLRELWPVGEQKLSDDGRFTYLGGRIPAPLDPLPWACSPLSTLGSRLSSAVPGLRGYIGFDLILPHTPDAPPSIVDINPRLTTSNLGYRALSQTNLAGRVLWPDRDWPPVVWYHDVIDFDAGGAIVRSPAGRR